MQAQALLRDGVRRLVAAGVPNAAGDARWLLAHALGVPKERLTLVLPDPAPARAAARFRALIAARESRQPVAQIIGTRQFFGRDFRVTRDVLDPRPETETLVQTALNVPFQRVLDLGTGSGAILLTLLAERPAASGVGVDLSSPALDVARRNAQVLGVCQRAAFIRSDWCDGVSGSFDLIVSNPPYIATSAHAALDADVRLHEPRIALVPACDDDDSGLGAYRILVRTCPARLGPGGWFMVEIGFDQGHAVRVLFEQAGLRRVKVVTDLSGHDRVVIGQKPA